MTTEETEITFIRCPSCRSLVPSVATRCRMCGHQFQKAEGAPPSPGGDEKRSRIRQRTISVTRGEGDQLNVSQALSSEPDVPSQSAEESSIPFVDHFDHDVSVEPEQPREKFRPPAAPAERTDIQSQERQSFSPPQQPAAAEPVKTPRPLSGSAPLNLRGEKSEPPADVHDEHETDFEEDGEDDGGLESDEHDDIEDNDSRLLQPSGEEPKRKRRRRRRRKKKGAGGLPGESPVDHTATQPSQREKQSAGAASAAPQTSPGLGRSPLIPGFHPREPEKPREPEHKSVRELMQEKESSFGGVHFTSQKREPAEPSRPRSEDALSQNTAVQPPQESISFQQAETHFEEHFPEKGLVNQVTGAEMETQQGSTQAGSHYSQASDPQAAAAGEGLLVGWLVNYSGDRRGAAIELRSGRFFVGRQRLRGSDLILSDDSVSTPHCLINASPADGMMVQDLMSERGTAIRKAGSQHFVNCTDPVKLQHGDWLRFGNYEVMVCLIPNQQRNGQ